MRKEQKELLVAELTERLRTAESVIVADYRGLTMPQIDNLRTELLKHGARFTVVKNTLTRRAAEAAGAEALLALLEGPTAIAFLETDGDPVAVAKALGAAARETRVLEVRGGVLEGRPITAADVESLAKLPPFEQLRGQVLGTMTSPLYAIVGLFAAPLQNVVGLIDARIEQLGGEAGPEPEASVSETQAPAPAGESEPDAEVGGAGPEPEASVSETQAPAPAGESEPEAEVGGAEDPQTPTADATESAVAEVEDSTESQEAQAEQEEEAQAEREEEAQAEQEEKESE